MIRFRDLSITRKQLLIIMSTTTVSLLMACGAFVYTELHNQKRDMADNMYMAAKIIGGHTTSLLLQDRKEANDTLNLLGTDKHIMAAVLYDASGKMFTAYQKQGNTAAISPFPLEDGFRTTGSHVELYRAIVHEGKQVGSIAILSDGSHLRNRLNHYLTITVIVVLVSMLAALGLSLQLQKLMTRPVMHLLDTTRKVSREQDYSYRAEKVAEDELGMLVDGFNNMLDQIQERDLALRNSKKNIEELSKQNELILMSAGEGICGVDPSGKTTFANPAAARLLGLTAEEIVGQPVGEVLQTRKTGPDGLRKGFDFTEGIGGEAHGADNELLQRRDGTLFSAEYLCTPILDHNNQTRGAVITFKDITDRKEAEEQLRNYADKLEASNKELESFAHVASHDLQEPLRKVRAFGDRLKAKCGDDLPDTGKDYIDRMQNAAERMQILINDILAFSRVTTKARPFAPFNLNREVDEIISDLEVRIEQTEGQVHKEELPEVIADETQMRQLFQNIIGNALKFHRPDVPPVVKLNHTLVSDEEGVPFHQFTISDNGIGFEQKYVDRIFKVFQRLHGRKEYEGTGIGLAICRKIVERHGGRINATSEPNVGTQFIFTLPVTPTENVQEEAQAEEPVAAAAS